MHTVNRDSCDEKKRQGTHLKNVLITRMNETEYKLNSVICSSVLKALCIYKRKPVSRLLLFKSALDV